MKPITLSEFRARLAEMVKDDPEIKPPVCLWAKYCEAKDERLTRERA